MAEDKKLEKAKPKSMMTSEEPKKEGKSESKGGEKAGHKRKHPFHQTLIQHHTDGKTHTMTHMHESGDASQNVSSAHPDLASVQQGLSQNVGGEEAMAQPAPMAAQVAASPAPSGVAPAPVMA